MQAMSKIDTNVNPLETVAPAKPAKSAESRDETFGKVLNDKRQAEQTEKPVQETVDNESKLAGKQQIENTDLVESMATELSSEKKTIQETLDALMSLIADTDASAQKDVGATPEELLTQLVAQLDSDDLQDEQLPVGIDLSALAEQLQNGSDEDREELLEQLAEQLVVQLEEQTPLKSQPEQVGELMPTQAMLPDVQDNIPQMDTLLQARRVLQRAIDAVTKQAEGAETVKENETFSQVVAGSDEQSAVPQEEGEPVEVLDQRFAGLLKPRRENALPRSKQGLQPQVQEKNAAAQNPEAASVVGEARPEVESGVPVEAVDQFAKIVQQGSEQQNTLQGYTKAAVPPVPQENTSAQQVQPVVQLASGQQVAESQIFDQVVARFSTSFNGESSKMVLRLQPAELGSLKVELQIEGDRIQANLHAQSQQVQEVLERNLPQLRNALAEHGLKVDQFQVDVNRDQNQQNFDQMAQQQQQRQQGMKAQPHWQTDWTEEETVPLAHLMQNGGGGISLHV